MHSDMKQLNFNYNFQKYLLISLAYRGKKVKQQIFSFNTLCIKRIIVFVI